MCGLFTASNCRLPTTLRRLFDLQSRQWRQLPVRGMSPLPRFLFGYTQYSPAGGGADRFVLFGGQTGALGGGRAAGRWLSLGLDKRHVWL